MTKSQERINTLVWSAAGIQTNLLYIFIIVFLTYNGNYEGEPSNVFSIFIPLVVLSIVLSVITILKGLKQKKSTTWGLNWIAIFHIPAIVGLIIAFIQL
jgi:hypothetical protein